MNLLSYRKTTWPTERPKHRIEPSALPWVLFFLPKVKGRNCLSFIKKMKPTIPSKRAPKAAAPKAELTAAVTVPASVAPVLTDSVVALPPAVPEPAVASIAPDTAPSEVVVAETESASDAEEDAPASHVAREKPSNVAGIYISHARVKHCINALGVNHAFSEAVSVYRATVAEHDAAVKLLESGKVYEIIEKLAGARKVRAQQERAATEGELAAAQNTVNELADKLPEAKENIAAAGRGSIRFSSFSPYAVSIVCDHIVKELYKAAVNGAIDCDKKLVKVEHLYAGGLKKCPVYGLVKDLPAVVETEGALAAAVTQKEHAAELTAALRKAETDFRKKYKITVKREKAQPVAASVAAPAEVAIATATTSAPAAQPEVADNAAATPASDNKKSFRFYISAICGDLKDNADFATMRRSNELIDHLDKIVYQFIHKISLMINIVIEGFKTKTVSEETVLKAVKLLTDGGVDPTEVVQFSDVCVPVSKKKTEGEGETKFVRRASKTVAYSAIYRQIEDIVLEKIAKLEELKVESDRVKASKKDAESDSDSADELGV